LKFRAPVISFVGNLHLSAGKLQLAVLPTFSIHIGAGEKHSDCETSRFQKDHLNNCGKVFRPTTESTSRTFDLFDCAWPSLRGFYIIFSLFFVIFASAIREVDRDVCNC